MIFVDTNYFLRFLLADIKVQYKKSKDLFQEAAAGEKDLFTSIIVMFEVYWVLSSFYDMKKAEVVRVLRKVMAMDFILIESRVILNEAIDLYQKTSFDLEDAYNLVFSKEMKAREFMTFDVKLKRKFG